MLIGKKAKETFKSAGICFGRVVAKPALRLKGQPSAAERLGGGKRDTFPTDRLNNESNGQWPS